MCVMRLECLFVCVCLIVCRVCLLFSSRFPLLDVIPLWDRLFRSVVPARFGCDWHPSTSTPTTTTPTTTASTPTPKGYFAGFRLALPWFAYRLRNSFHVAAIFHRKVNFYKPTPSQLSSESSLSLCVAAVDAVRLCCCRIARMYTIAHCRVSACWRFRCLRWDFVFPRVC